MKKAYQKPAMYLDRFSLEQSIASGCGITNGGTLGEANLQNKSVCGWDMGNGSIWTEAITQCSIKFKPDIPFNGVCYNNPNGGKNIFTS